MFRHPCSYLVLSSQFDALPEPVSKYVRLEMSAILNGEKSLPLGVRLEKEQRIAIREMLIALKPNWLVQSETKQGP